MNGAEIFDYVVSVFFVFFYLMVIITQYFVDAVSQLAFR